MKTAAIIRMEHKAVCKKMAELMKEGSPNDQELFFRLYSIQLTLEWVHPTLIKTNAKGADRRIELAGYRHFVSGPLHATLYP